MTRGSFIVSLLRAFGEEYEDIFSRGLENGWLEYEDKLYSNEPIARKNAARIIHMFLLKEKGIIDLPSIHDAEVLRDLYDCRICANHIAQVYLRGIMDAKDLSAGGGFLWFDLDGEDDQTVIEEYIRRAVETVKNAKI